MSRAGLLIVCILSANLVVGCDIIVPDDSFLPGLVEASVRNVEPEFIHGYARAYGIEVGQIYFPSTYLVQIVAHNGAPQDYVAALSSDPLVDTVRVSRSDELEIVVRRVADESYIRGLIETQGGLEISYIYRGQDAVLFGVPYGKENQWVRRLKREKFVVSAERSQLVSVR